MSALPRLLFIYYNKGVVYIASFEAYVGGELITVAGAAVVVGAGVVAARSA